MQENDVMFQIEEKIGDEIMETVHRLQLPFKLDFPTEGRGNCFPISIIQQCHRPEKTNYLCPAARQVINQRTGHLTLRQKLQTYKFAIKFILMKFISNIFANQA